MRLKTFTVILILVPLTVTAVSASNETVKNTHNDDLNDISHINENDYYLDEKKTAHTYTSDTASYNNVTMSNGYDAYAIQDGGYDDSKTHPSLWNDTETVVGHWHYTGKAPIGEYLKILFFRYHNYLQNLNKYNPNIPDSIYVQSFVWDLYRNAGNVDRLSYAANRYAVELYNNGYRANNSTNVQWPNETAYRVFDFPGFKNLDSSHKDLWGLRVRPFSVEIENETFLNNSTMNDTIKKDAKNTSEMSPKNTQDIIDEIELPRRVDVEDSYFTG